MDATAVSPAPPADPLAPSLDNGDIPPEQSEVKQEGGMPAPQPAADDPQTQRVNDSLINEHPLPPSPLNKPPGPPINQVQDVAASLISLGRDGETISVTDSGVYPLPPNNDNLHTDVESPNKKPKTAAKYSMKPRDPKRDTSIPFEEMQRLMRVYGPIKCLRNRTPKESGKDLKQDSIKRKFYRWFPDFDSRFERTPEGWYKPKYGHEEEMQYRADMRKKDQDELVKKRNTKRAGRKAKEAAPSPSANV
jgi:hypothetical protein